jgi:HEAT repeat protein
MVELLFIRDITNCYAFMLICIYRLSINIYRYIWRIIVQGEREPARLEHRALSIANDSGQTDSPFQRNYYKLFLASLHDLTQSGPMWTRRRIASITAVLAVLALIASLVFHSSEPSYHGKSLSAWLEQARQNKEIENAFPDVHLDTPSARALRAMGKDALPSLIRMAHTRDTLLRKRMIDLSQRYDWLGIHPQPFDDLQMEYVCGFSILGPAANGALPELISMLGDRAPEVRAFAAFAIGTIGPDAAPAIPALQRLITNSLSANVQGQWKGEDRGLAAYALGSMGPAAQRAVPQIELLRKDSDLFVRSAAEAAFVKIAGNGLATILESLKDPSDWTNWFFAASATTFLGTNGAQAIPLLVEALQHTNAAVRDTALNSLSAIHTAPELTVPAILPLVAAANTNAGQRAIALSILRNLGPSARGMVPTTTLLQALKDPDGNVRVHATNALRQINPEAAGKAGIDSDAERN